MLRSPLRRLRSGQRPDRLLVAIPGGEYGGAERYAVRIAAAAVQDGWEVAAAVRRHDALAAMRRDLRDAGVRVLQMVRGERTREFAGFLAMVVANRPDVVHLTLPWPVGAGRSRGLRTTRHSCRARPPGRPRRRGVGRSPRLALSPVATPPPAMGGGVGLQEPACSSGPSGSIRQTSLW